MALKLRSLCQILKVNKVGNALALAAAAAIQALRNDVLAGVEVVTLTFDQAHGWIVSHSDHQAHIA